VGRDLLNQSLEPFVSIIIQNFNGEGFIEQCLSSVLKTEYSNYEVIFVDSASTDNSLGLVEKKFGNDARIKIIRLARDLGSGAGSNIGYKHASGSYIVFLNTDTVVEPLWLRYLVEALEHDETIGLAQSVLLNMRDDRIQCAGWLQGDYFMSLYPIGIDKPATTEFPATFDISFASGTAMIITRGLVDRIGLFDERFFWGYDDTLLSIKTLLGGKRVVAVSKSKVHHAGQATLKATGNLARMRAFYGLITHISLIFDVYQRFDDLAKALFLGALSIVNGSRMYLLNKNPSGLFAQAKAVRWILKNFRIIWQNRTSHWSNSEISPQMFLSKFIRVKLGHFSLYLLPPSIRSRFCREIAVRYENTLIQSK
jgi:hypothetical protein